MAKIKNRNRNQLILGDKSNLLNKTQLGVILTIVNNKIMEQKNLKIINFYTY